jgi:hypothetical protein
MSKYQPLTDFLNHLKADEWRPTFLELERIIGIDLPKTARSSEAWWDNQGGAGKPHKAAWLDAGWRTDRVDLEKQQVTFRRRQAEEGTNASGTATEVMRAADAVYERSERIDTAKKVGVGAGVTALAVGLFAGVAALVVRAFRKRRKES